MPADIRDEKTCDAPRRAARHVIDVTTRVGGAERFAKYPRIQPRHHHTAVDQRIATPHFHALHEMF